MMTTTTRQQLKDKVDVLEKTLLAIDELNNINQESLRSGTPSFDLEHSANLLNHLIEPALYQVEALRMLITDICEGKKVP